MKYTSRSKEEAVAWHKGLRSSLCKILKLEDLVASRSGIPLNPKQLSSDRKGDYDLREIEISSTTGRRIQAVLTVPVGPGGAYPAVVCIHGHGGNRHSVHDPNSGYGGFAASLAEKGYVTISTDVGRHEVYEKGRILMGERLWDLMRCVDYLESLAQVDGARIGCGGLSLGGEMAMWLGAMDERVSATVSCGFLTTMDQMEQNHCMCWKFSGLRKLADFADIYALIAPRPLLCQNGLKEPPTQFPVPLAREVLKGIKVAYSDLGVSDGVALVAHEGGHEVHLPSLLEFFDRHLCPTGE